MMQLQFLQLLVWLLAFTPWLVRNCSSSKILMITLVSTKSHKIPFYVLAKELIERNNSIVFISPFPPELHMPGLEEVAPAKLVNHNREFINRDTLGARLKGKEPFPILELFTYVADMCSILLESREVQEMIHSEKKFDILIVDAFFSECSMGLVYFFKVPFIFINSGAMYTPLFSDSGSPVMYSVTPYFLKPYTENMNLVERTLNTGIHLVGNAVLLISANIYLQKILRNHFGPAMPGVLDVKRNVSFILQNGHLSITYPRPYLPNVAEVACIHCRAANPLNKEMEDFINKGGENGFILMSFGGGVKLSGMPAELLKIILNTLRKLPQQILWKWDDDTKIIPDMPPNVMLSQWLPQEDLLGHKRIRTFITHCGMHSIIEAVYHGVPVVCIPVFADQDTVAAKVQLDGYGIIQNIVQLSEEHLLKAITDVIHNPKYKIAAMKRQYILRDQKEKPVDRAIYWIEYVIRHDGAQHLKSPSRNMNFIQYHSVDTMAILMGAALFLVFALGWLLKTSLRCLLALFNTTPEKTKEN